MDQKNDRLEKEGIHDRSRRQERIAEYLLQHSSAQIQDLAELFKVSTMTVHRDLDELERQGMLRKVRGGATAQPSSLFESDIRFRLGSASQEKLAIARCALQYVEPGQAVMMDDSTTTLALARLLPEVIPLTVITNSLTIMVELTPVKGISLISLGGEYVPRYGAFTGLICEQAVSSLRANILFMSTSAISDNVAFHQEQDIVKVKRLMMNSAALRILLVDSSKLHKTALHRLATIDQFDRVIVDAHIDADCLDQLRKANINVEVAPLKSGLIPGDE
jgi:DeoR/GlpR family transcriptional regulator of sugar metabolism